MFHMESESNLDFFYQKNNKVEVKIRQHFRDVYFEDGAIYICNTEWFLKNKVFLNKYSDVTIMNKNHSIDIDSHEDLSLARLLIKKN